MEAPKRVLDYLKLLEVVTGEKAYVAGGAARDLFHEAEPRDYDMFIPALINRPELIKGRSLGSGVSVGSYDPAYGDVGRYDSYMGVFKTSVADPTENLTLDPRTGRVGPPLEMERIQGYDIDIICRDVEARTIEGIVEGFDANFNLYWFGSDGEIKFLDNAIHLTQEVEIFDQQNRGPHYYNRVLKKLGAYNV